MTTEELELRKPVWIAMSDLFLDTDVRLLYASTARVLAESPFTVDELGLIFKKEVAPVLGWNLLAVAGVWDGFDEDWLVSRITPRTSAKPRLPSFAPAAKQDWKAVVVLIEALRRLTEPERSRRLALWEQLSKLFVVSTGAPVLEGWSLEELEAVWRNEMWPSYGLTVDLHVKHSLEGYPDREQIEQAWTRCRNAVS